MTKLQFISEVLGTINLLLETEVNSCAIHQASVCVASAFNKFEELADQPISEKNTPSDLEHYHHLIESLKVKGLERYQEEKV